jgi:Cu/Ag efflux protein CusF
MKQSLSCAVLGAALLCLAPAALLAAEHDHPMGAAAAGTAAVSAGTVKKIDKAAGKLTIAHGPLVNLGMGAMTMSFKADPPQALAALKEGDRIRFVAEDRQGMLYATRIEVAK